MRECRGEGERKVEKGQERLRKATKGEKGEKG